MLTNYRYKNLSERGIQEVITYCLTVMPNNERNFNNWKATLSTVSESTADKVINCTNELEADDLKRYLVSLRGFKDGGGSGLFLLINRVKN